MDNIANLKPPFFVNHKTLLRETDYGSNIEATFTCAALCALVSDLLNHQQRAERWREVAQSRMNEVEFAQVEAKIDD